MAEKPPQSLLFVGARTRGHTVRAQGDTRKKVSASPSQSMLAVGTKIALRPPHRAVLTRFMHMALTLSNGRQNGGSAGGCLNPQVNHDLLTRRAYVREALPYPCLELFYPVFNGSKLGG